jgi:hypothetical protein
VNPSHNKKVSSHVRKTDREHDARHCCSPKQLPRSAEHNSESVFALGGECVHPTTEAHLVCRWQWMFFFVDIDEGGIERDRERQ